MHDAERIYHSLLIIARSQQANLPTHTVIFYWRNQVDKMRGLIALCSQETQEKVRMDAYGAWQTNKQMICMPSGKTNGSSPGTGFGTPETKISLHTLPVAFKAPILGA
jgi:hypothetical protein